MDQSDFVRFVPDALERLQIEYLVVGSFASIAYGESRFTHDIDVVVQVDESTAEALCREFPGPDWYVSIPAARAAARDKRQFKAIHTLSGNKADLIVARD